MKRRNFLSVGATTLAGAPIAASAAGRLYGTPQSATSYVAPTDERSNVLRLSLAKHDIPTDTWNTIVSLDRLYTDSLSDPTTLAGLSADDPAVLSKYGLANNLVDTSSEEMLIIKSMLDEDVQQTASAGDFVGYLRSLEKTGLFDGQHTSKLGGRVRDYILQNASEFEEMVSNSGLNFSGLTATPAAGPPTPIFPVVVATVAVILTAAVVAIAVVVSAVKVTVNIDGANAAPSAGKFLMMDKAGFKRMQDSIRVAHLLGGTEIVRAAYQNIVEQESEALSSAITEVILAPRGLDNEETISTLKTSMRTALERTYGLAA